MGIKFVLKKLPSETLLGEYVFNDAMFTVGSDDANNLVLDEIAPEQAVIVNEGDHLKLINSNEGTHLNGQKLRREAIEVLSHADEIRIGNYVIFVVDDESDVPLRQKIEKPKSLPDKTAKEFKEFLPAAESVKQNRYQESEVKSMRNFAAVLDNLRTEEDSFYFSVQSDGDEIDRIPLENAEIPIGKTDKGKIAYKAEQISVLYGIARKDWSGILLESQRRNSIFINDQPLATTQRLRNDDRIRFSSAPKGFELVLHEPSLLVALEPLLNAKNSNNGLRNGNVELNKSALETDKSISLFERRYFGYFSFLEVLTMIIGTLIGAVMFFLFFEIVFS